MRLSPRFVNKTIRWIGISLWVGLLLIVAGSAHAQESPMQNLARLSSDRDRQELKGIWEFYWQQLLEPEDAPHAPSALITAQDFRWTSIQDIAQDRQFPGMGYATYRLRFTGLPPRAQNYELKLYRVISSYKAILYDEKNPSHRIVLTSGRVASTAEQYVPWEIPKTLNFSSPSTDTVWILLLQVANFHHARGGLIRAPEVAWSPTLSRSTQREVDFIFVAVGVLLVMTLYNFVIYLRRRQEISSLILAICCFIAMLRSIANGYLLPYLFPDPITILYHLQYQLDYMSITALSCAYVCFIHFSFPGHIRPLEKPVVPYYLAFNLLLSVCPFLTPISFSTDLKFFYVLAVFSNIGITFLIHLRTVRLGLQSSKLALSGSLMILVTAFYDLFCSYGWLPEPYLSPYALTAFIFMQSQVMAGRFAKAFRTTEHLTQKLREEVDLQTQKLHKQRDKLEKQHGDLLKSHKDLQSMHEEKSGFFRQISHEIRTPLTLILGTVANTRKTEKYQQGLDVIEKNSQRLLRLVNQLLDLQRSQSIKEQLYRTPLPFVQVTRNCMEYVEQTCHERGLTFLWINELNQDDEKILGQVDALEKIQLNFLSNALKYTGRGGQIRVRLQRFDRWLRCTVEDTGPGIREEDLGQLFQVFSRLRDADQKVREGTGLGLALCRELAESMQGRVGVSSELGVGSKFWMEFPRLLSSNEYMNLIVYANQEQDFQEIQKHIGQRTLLKKCMFTKDRASLLAKLEQHPCRMILVNKEPDTYETLDLLQEIHRKYPDTGLFLLIDQKERVEYVHQVMQSKMVKQILYRPLQAVDIESLEAHLIHEELAEKPLLDVMLLDDHEEVRAQFSRGIAEYTLIEQHKTCRTLEEARQVLQQYRVKVVVADITLNEHNVSGIDLLRFAAQAQPQAFRILLSGESSAYKIQEIIRTVHFHKMLIKPFIASRDMDILQSFVDQSPLGGGKNPEDLGSQERVALHLSDALTPAAERMPTAPAATRPANPLTASRSKPHILLVDDVMDMRQMIAEILSDAGMIVEECSDGKEALEKLQQINEHFDLVISDWMMPRMTGLEFLQNLRANPKTKSMPCILLTAKMRNELDGKLILDSITRYVTKPFDYHSFPGLVRSMLPVNLQTDSRLKQDQTWWPRYFSPDTCHQLLKSEYQFPDSVQQKTLTLLHIRLQASLASGDSSLSAMGQFLSLAQACGWEQEGMLEYKSTESSRWVFGSLPELSPRDQVQQARSCAQQLLGISHSLAGAGKLQDVRLRVAIAQGPCAFLWPQELNSPGFLLQGPALDELDSLLARAEPFLILCNAAAAEQLDREETFVWQEASSDLHSQAAFAIKPKDHEAA